MAGAGIHPYHQQWTPAPPPQPSPAAGVAPPTPILLDNPNRSATDEVEFEIQDSHFFNVFQNWSADLKVFFGSL